MKRGAVSGLLRERMDKFIRSRLYPVISSEFCSGRSPVEIFYAAASAGVGIIQLREKHMALAELCALARECRRIADRFGTLLVIDDHAEVAIESGADGVHVGQDDVGVAEIKKMSPDLLVGKSTHNAAEIAAAQLEGADYINIGPIYATATKNVSYPAVGVEALRKLIPLAHVPFSVMGGIKREHIELLSGMGARHIAMVTELTTAPDVSVRVRELDALFSAEP